LFQIGHIWVTNQMLMATVAGVLMVLLFPVLFRRSQDVVPSGARNFFESILEFLRVEVIRPALKEHTDRFVPFLWTVFFFILFCNLLGFIPLGEIMGLISLPFAGRQKAMEISHFGGTATGNISTTGALAACALVAIHVSGIMQVGRDLIRGTYGHHPHHEEHSSNGAPSHEAAMDVEHMRSEGLPADVPQQFHEMSNPVPHYADAQHVGHGLGYVNSAAEPKHGRGMNPVLAILIALPLYLWNFAPHPFRPQPGQSGIGWIADVPMWLMLLILELIGAVIKPFALMMRLFANMIAGHLVLAVLITFIPVTLGIAFQLAVGVPVTMLSLLIRMLELFVAFLQAYIFMFLTTLFIASAVAPEH
jgi:F0F1-type ATP synthase membrane subunit a